MRTFTKPRPLLPLLPQGPIAVPGVKTMLVLFLHDWPDLPTRQACPSSLIGQRSPGLGKPPTLELKHSRLGPERPWHEGRRPLHNHWVI